jgi:chemotaxis protein CheZ
MSVKRKVFRVELGRVPEDFITVPAAAAAAAAPAMHDPELMAELKSLRALVEHHHALILPNLGPQHFEEMRKLKNELDIIHEAIDRTKQEITTLHVTGFRGPEMERVTKELGAVVGGTEQATQAILAVAEEIDQTANMLAAALKNTHEQGLAQDIQDRVIKIFEACNFQDLTGQRITKVVATLRFIEEHILRMIEIWGGLEALSAFAPEAMTVRDGDAKLVNGPRLEDDIGHASQNDIDALFN